MGFVGNAVYRPHVGVAMYCTVCKKEFLEFVLRGSLESPELPQYCIVLDTVCHFDFACGTGRNYEMAKFGGLT